MKCGAATKGQSVKKGGVSPNRMTRREKKRAKQVIAPVPRTFLQRVADFFRGKP
jgi:hypothetical protein